MPKASPNVSASIAARVAQLAGDAPADASGADASTTADSAPGPNAGAPPTGEGSGAESAAVVAPAPAGEAGAPPAAAGESNGLVQKAQHELLAEKLRETRERREAQRLTEQARRTKEGADTDRKAAAEERAKWEALRKGNFKEAIAAMGRDPREVFEEMSAEAREAGKPETQLARARADFERQMAEAVEPLKKKIDDLEEREKRTQEVAAQQAFAEDFSRGIQRQEFTPLLVEYEPETLFEIVRSMHSEPQRIFAAAKRLNVTLTARPGKYNMHDICNVLLAQHQEHERGREQRRARLQASTTSQAAPQQAPAKAPTVNGTADKRNAAGNALGNDLATSRASQTTPPRLTRRERVQKIIDEGG